MSNTKQPSADTRRYFVDGKEIRPLVPCPHAWHNFCRCQRDADERHAAATARRSAFRVVGRAIPMPTAKDGFTFAQLEAIREAREQNERDGFKFVGDYR